MAKLIVHNPPTVKLKASGYTGTPTGDIELTENNRTYNVSPFATATTAIPEEEKTVNPSTAEQVVVADEGLLKKVTVYPTPLEAKTVEPSTEQQTIIPQSPAIGFSQVTIEPVTPSIDPDIQPQNIKQGVDILGVQGTLKPPTLITKQITENGVYKAEDDNADGYRDVEVDVSDPIVNKLLDGTLEELINHSVTSLGTYAFYYQTSLQKVYCREVVTLGFAAFQFAECLRVAFFPKLASIDYNIFYRSGYELPSGMQALILKRKTTLRDRSSFTQNTTNFYVPSALISWYSTATNWSVYYGDGRILAIEDNLEFLESFGFTEEELLSAEE